MAPQLWPKNRDDIDFVIKRLITSAGKPSAMKRMVGGATSGWGMSLQDQIDFRHLTAASKGQVSTNDAMLSLSEMTTRSQKTVDDFEAVFDEFKRKKLLEQATAVNWKFAIPWRVKFADDVRFPFDLKLLGTNFRVLRWKNAVRGWSKEKVNSQFINLRHHRYLTECDYCFVAQAKGTDRFQAWRRIAPAFEALRGILELQWGFTTQPMSMPSRARRKVPHPAWMLIRNESDKSLDTLMFTVEEDDLAPKPRELVLISNDVFSALKKNVKLCVGNPTSDRDTRHVIADALRLYAQAMETSHEHQCYIALWQLAETITRVGDHRGSGEKLRSRMAAILSSKLVADTRNLGGILDSLFRLRNEVVHRGLHEYVDQDDANFLKVCCDAALAWLIDVRQKLPTTTHLEHFFDMMNANDHEMASITETLAYIKAARRDNAAKKAGVTDTRKAR